MESGNEKKAHNFTSRYDALGIDLDELLEKGVCSGYCEGTGIIPVRKDDTLFSKQWAEAESREASDDGWHFIKCPDCGGSGLAHS